MNTTIPSSISQESLSSGWVDIPSCKPGHICRITIIGIGIIMVLGGVFTLLAANQVLATVNLIGQYGAWGQGIGYALLGTGAITIVIASFRLRQLYHAPSSDTSYSAAKSNQLLIDEWLFKGQQNGCNGFVSKADANIVLEYLDKNKPSCIRFNRDAITGSIEGGTCSAMSLEFLATYFKIKEDCPVDTDYQPYMLQKLRESGSKFASSSQEKRDWQAAYNAIEVVKLSEDIDYAKNKMQSLINHHGFKIDWSSDHIDTTLSKDVASVMGHLPDGAFLMRILKPANNEKLEERGHSLVYIKENGLRLFYDPNFGLKAFDSSNQVPFLLDNFSTNFREFQIKEGRFYHIQPNMGNPKEDV